MRRCDDGSRDRPDPENPGRPVLYEACVRSTLDYVVLAERASGPISRKVAADYVWGDALSELERRHPDLRIVNLETSITASGTAETKEVNYRMHPDGRMHPLHGRIMSSANSPRERLVGTVG